MRQFQLLSDDVLLVGDATALHLFSIRFLFLQIVLNVNFQIKHHLVLLLLNLELLEHDLGLIALILQTVLELHCHLSFSLEMLGLLISLSDTSALDLVLELKVLLVNSAFLGESLLDLNLAHLLLVLQVLDTRLGDRNVNLYKVGLLASLHRLSLRFLGQVAILELSCLLVLRPTILQDRIVENVHVLVQSVTNLL